MNYRYVAYKGDRTLASGVQAAASADIAAKILTSQGYNILSLKPSSGIYAGNEGFPQLFRKVSLSMLVTFSRQFALLHESGVDIVSALDLLKSNMDNRRFKRVLEEIIIELNKGGRLSDAMGKHPEIFPKIYIQSIKMGERTGNLEVSLRQIADYMDREAKASKSVKNAMRYPVMILIVGVIVIAAMLTFVLPAFTDLYRSLNVELPALTRIMIGIGDWFGAHGLYVLAVIGGLALLFYYRSRTQEGKLWWAGVCLKIPILGRVIHLNELIRYCWSISILYKAGLAVPDILLMTIESSRNLVMKRALIQVHQSILKGEGLAKPMGEDPIFLKLMVQMVYVGEATGNLDKTLLVTAQTFEAEAEDKMRAFIALIQPVITVILGGVVALIALSLVSAMYSMYGQFA